jgi:ankyrin repeat protein
VKKDGNEYLKIKGATMNSIKTQIFCIFMIFVLILPVFSQDISRIVLGGNLEFVKSELEKNPELLNFKNDEGETLMHFAVMGQSRPVAEYLISKGLSVDEKNGAGQTPLFYAAWMGAYPMVDFLVEKGAVILRMDQEGNTPFHIAASRGKKEILELFLNKGIDINSKSENGRNLLHFAARTDRLNVFELGIKRGADPGVKDKDGKTPLELAVENGSVHTVDYALTDGLDFEINPAASGLLLMNAVEKSHKKIVDILLEKGVDISSKNSSGGTILHSAVVGGMKDVLVLAIEKGIDVNAVDQTGKTALHIACLREDISSVSLLVNKNADLNRKDAKGRSPYHIAEDWGFVEIMKFLSKKGGDKAERFIYRIPEKSGHHPEIRVRYIANNGFLITSGSKKVLLDALHTNPYGYDSTPEKVFRKMINLESPFGNINVLFVSHDHQDHFSSEMVSDFLLKNPETFLVTNQSTVDALKSYHEENYQILSGRVKNINPPWKEKVQSAAGGIELTVFGVNHRPADMEPYLTDCCLINFEGRKILFVSDLVPEANEEYFKAFQFQNDEIDIAFFDQYFLQNPSGQKIIKEFVKPKFIIAMHINSNEFDSAETAIKKYYPDVIVFKETLEQRVFK